MGLGESACWSHKSKLLHHLLLALSLSRTQADIVIDTVQRLNLAFFTISSHTLGKLPACPLSPDRRPNPPSRNFFFNNILRGSSCRRTTVKGKEKKKGELRPREKKKGGTRTLCRQKPTTSPSSAAFPYHPPKVQKSTPQRQNRGPTSATGLLKPRSPACTRYLDSACIFSFHFLDGKDRIDFELNSHPIRFLAYTSVRSRW